MEENNQRLYIIKLCIGRPDDYRTRLYKYNDYEESLIKYEEMWKFYNMCCKKEYFNIALYKDIDLDKNMLIYRSFVDVE